MVSETWALFRSTQATAASLPLRLVENIHSISVTRDPVTRASTGIWEKIRDNQY